MIRLMYSGVSGMRSHQVRMDIIGNNISNENTTAYKSTRADFKDTLYQAIGASGNAKGACQVGTGVGIAGITSNFDQGPLQPTGRKLDLAIKGSGFFGALDTYGNLKFTRDGAFFFDKAGYLLNASGLNVVDADGEAIIIEDLHDREKVEISENGEIFKSEFDLGTGETEYTTLGQIGLFNFQNVPGLSKTGDNLFLENDNTGERTSNAEGPDGFGTIYSGYLEAANLDLIGELSNLIATQRGYQANAKAFMTADEVLQETIQLKR
ncbi:MAG TPA: flagellar hook basal-body protein [Desulfotomaculum sp.]|nr:MAG: hypothetical protein JL56_04995 [Desulfotomaculum sp. BICA1-6]HBX23698.1 flagellar hook basal-body protein [Desulfotomaculum sp.]